MKFTKKKGTFHCFSVRFDLNKVYATDTFLQRKFKTFVVQKKPLSLKEAFKQFDRSGV